MNLKSLVQWKEQSASNGSIQVQILGDLRFSIVLGNYSLWAALRGRSFVMIPMCTRPPICLLALNVDHVSCFARKCKRLIKLGAVRANNRLVAFGLGYLAGPRTRPRHLLKCGVTAVRERHYFFAFVPVGLTACGG